MVEEAVVEKKFVVVAEVPVARVKMRSVIVELLMEIEPTEPVPKLKFVANRFVEDAVVE